MAQQESTKPVPMVEQQTVPRPDLLEMAQMQAVGVDLPVESGLSVIAPTALGEPPRVVAMHTHPVVGEEPVDDEDPRQPMLMRFCQGMCDHAWKTMDFFGVQGTPMTVILNGFTTSSTLWWAQPVQITDRVRMSSLTMGFPIPRAGRKGHRKEMSFIVGGDLGFMSRDCVYGIVTTLALEQPKPVVASVVLFGIDPSDNRGGQPVGAVVLPHNLPCKDGLVGGRDFTPVDTLAAPTVANPWHSVLQAMKEVNRDMAAAAKFMGRPFMAVNKRAFISLAPVLKGEDPVTHSEHPPMDCLDALSVELLKDLEDAGIIPSGTVGGYLDACWHRGRLGPFRAMTWDGAPKFFYTDVPVQARDGAIR